MALTKRVEHTKRLLDTWQDALGIDVYKKHREKEQQKVEKEVFPECIQAISKYSNKRKSLISERNKDNSSLFLPGEKTSPIRPSRMEKSYNYLQQWLDNIVDDSPEKPSSKQLTSLNKCTRRRSNAKTSTAVKRRSDLIMNNFYESEATRKRTKSKNEKDESGIVMDDYIHIEESEDETKQHDTFDIINVTQYTQHDAPVVDKDRLAWLAVLEAENNRINETPSLRLECSEIIQYTNDIEKSNEVKQQGVGNTPISKVPFFKKSSFNDFCKNCIVDNNTITNRTESSTPKNVEITIESKAFTTTIKVTQVTPNKNSHKKQSVSVQTDITDMETAKVNNNMPQIKPNEELIGNNTNIERDSIDLFTGEVKITNDHIKNYQVFNLGAVCHEQKPKPDENYNVLKTLKPSLIKELEPIPVFVNQPRTDDGQNRLPSQRSQTTVQDSDTSDDDQLNKSETLTVTAEVHRSRNQYDYTVFSELIESSPVQRSTKHKKRGRSPNSSDSSDKENRDPNRGKRIKMEKKDPFKNKNRKKLGIVN